MTRPPEDEPLLLSPPLPPPQAVSAIAPAIPVAISAAWRLLNFTCDASLVPRARGERTGGTDAGLRHPARDLLGKAFRAGVRLLRASGRPWARAAESVHVRHRFVTWAHDRPTSHNFHTRPWPATGPLPARMPPARRPSSDFPGEPVCRSALPGYPRGRPTDQRRSRAMSDKMENKAQELAGRAKSAVGGATDDRDLQAEGEKDKTAGNLKQAGEKVKDAFK